MAEPTDPTTAQGDDTALEHFYAELHSEHLEALWLVNAKLMPFEPKPRMRPYLWRFDTLARLADQAGKLIPIERGGDRRVLGCINPSLGGSYGATSTLWAARPYLGPQESAPGHRHSPSALRFVVEGEGAWTTVDGDRCHMIPGDLVVSLPYTWNNHTNNSDRQMMWLHVHYLTPAIHLDARLF